MADLQSTSRVKPSKVREATFGAIGRSRLLDADRTKLDLALILQDNAVIVAEPEVTCFAGNRDKGAPAIPR